MGLYWSQNETDRSTEDLTVRFAQENSTWGFDRIQGDLATVSYRISDSTVSKILKSQDIEPAPMRRRTGSWATFLKAHWDVKAATDFTTVEVRTKGGLVTFYLLFVMELKTRRVHFSVCTTNPNAYWMKQTARELTNFDDGFLIGKRHLIMDCATKFSDSFRTLLTNEGVNPVRLPPRAPNMNPYLERLWGSLKSECLHRMILFGEKATRKAVNQYLEHYHTARCHQGLEHNVIVPADRPPGVNAPLETMERHGGLPRPYRRADRLRD